MSDTPEQANLRKHLAELRQSAHAIGHDIALHAEDLDRKIDRLGRSVGKDAKYLYWELDEDMASLRKSLASDVRSIPGHIASGAETAGTALKDGAVEVYERAGDAARYVGKHAAEGTKNTLARAAGVRRTPMKEWHSPGSEESSSD